MFKNGLERFLMSKKHGIDVKFVQIGPLIAEILTGPYMGPPPGYPGPPRGMAPYAEKTPSLFFTPRDPRTSSNEDWALRSQCKQVYRPAPGSTPTFNAVT